MKKPFLIALLFMLLALISTWSINAQKSQRLTSTPKAFQIFYAKFRNAVVKSDKKTIVSLARFPFEYGWDAGDEGTYSKTQFIKQYSSIFGRTKKFFDQRNPTFYVENGIFNLTNEEDASHYIFKKSGLSYKFTAIIVEP
jgi:hypothetical protein